MSEGPRQCKVCKRKYGGWPDGPQIVSPQGVEHIEDRYGCVLCGKDASGAGWWWPA